MMKLIRTSVLAATMSAAHAGAEQAQLSTSVEFNSSSTEYHEELLGVIDYGGGFHHQMNLTFPEPIPLQRIRVAIPRFCQGLEVLQVSSRSNGQTFLAHRVAPGRFDFDLRLEGDALVDELLFSLNGPTSTECQVPVFALESQPPSAPSEPDGSWSDCQVQVRGTSAIVSGYDYDRTLPWPERDVRRFMSQAPWTQAPTVNLSRDRNLFTVQTIPPSCVSYLIIQYDQNRCGSDFQINSAQGFTLGTVYDQGYTIQLLALLDRSGRWNRCMMTTGRGLVINRTSNE